MTAVVPEPIRAVIAEDERVLREDLRHTLSALWPELAVSACVRHGHEALAALEVHAPHILFLDIQMPGMSGLEVARRASGRCHVVFVTAHDEYALAAFEHGAVDYVMKPLSRERLSMTIERLKLRLEQQPANLHALLDNLATRLGTKPHLRWLTATQGDDTKLVTVDDVCYFQSEGKHTRLVLPTGSAMARRTLRDLGDELDPAFFWQVHRSLIVNIREVDGVRRDIRGHLFLRLKRLAEKLPVSEPYAPRFKDL